VLNFLENYILIKYIEANKTVPSESDDNIPFTELNLIFIDSFLSFPNMRSTVP